MHGLAVLPGGRQASVLRWPGHDSDEHRSRHRIGADQVLVVRMLQVDAVQHHGDMAVVRELLIAECLKLADETGHADVAARDPAVRAAAKRAVSGRAATTAPAQDGY